MENNTGPPDLSSMTHDDLRRALTLIAGKWKVEILWLLNQRTHRFGELKRTHSLRVRHPDFALDLNRG